MKSKLKVAFILVLIKFSSLLAQDYKQYPTLVQPSPSAYSITRYGDIPVSMFTGNPNIEIPIFTIQAKDFEFPIVLKHHGGAIKTDEMASNVGLGWSISSTAAVSRSIRGLPDECHFGFSSLEQHVIDQIVGIMSEDTYPSMEELERRQRLYEDYYFGSRDITSDIYYFSFNGINGKIYFNFQMEPFIDCNNFIYLDDYLPNYYSIRDVHENKYYFYDAELTEYHEDAGKINSCFNLDLQKYPTSLYLSRIETASGEVITFNYSIIPGVQYTAVNQGMTLRLNNNPYNSSESFNNSEIEVNQIRLDKITTSNVEILFFTNENVDRLDINNKSRLDKITIIDRITGNAIKIVEFDYSYFNFYGTYRQGNYLSNDLRYRLKLDALRIKDSENIISETYNFDYYKANGYYALPARDTKCIDHWGYINANPYNVLTPFNRFAVGDEDRIDRSPNEGTIIQGSLKSIRYPTGGTAEFIYETKKDQNNSPVDGTRILKIIKDTKISGDVYVENYKYEKEDGTSSGKLYKQPLYGERYASDFNIWNEVFGYNKVYPVNKSLYSIDGPQLGHERIIKYITNLDGSKIQGREVYKFNNNYHYLDESLYVGGGSCDRHFTSQYDAGQLERHDIYNSDNQLLKSTIYSYLSEEVHSDYIPSGFYLHDEVGTAGPRFHYGIPRFRPRRIFSKLNYTISESYNTGGVLSVKTNFVYPPDFNFNNYRTYLPNSEIQINYKTNEELFRKNTLYFSDGLPESVERWENNKIVNYEKYQYLGKTIIKKISGMIKSSDNYTNSSNIPLKLDFDAEVDFPNFYIKHFKDNNGQYVSYLWGYNYSLPVAKIVNASFNEVQTALAKQLLSVEDINLISKEGDLNLIAAMHQLRIDLPQAFITSYTYKPHIGITSETDPNGKITRYTYDSFGRLISIKDHEDKILKVINYNFRQN